MYNHTQLHIRSSAFQVVSQSPIPYPTDDDNLFKNTLVARQWQSTQTSFPTILHFPNTRPLCVHTCQCVIHITHMLRVHAYHIQDIDGDIQDAWLSAPQLMSRS